MQADDLTAWADAYIHSPEMDSVAWECSRGLERLRSRIGDEARALIAARDRVIAELTNEQHRTLRNGGDICEVRGFEYMHDLGVVDEMCGLTTLGHEIARCLRG